MHFLKRIWLIGALLLTQFTLGTFVSAQTSDMTNQGLNVEAPQEVQRTPKTLYSFNVDTQKIQNTRLGRVNHERVSRGLQPLILDETLNSTSIERTNYLGEARQFTNTHRRPGQSCKNYRCYDPADRFAERGVSRAAAETTLFGYYRCDLDDCTESLVESLRGRLGGPSGFLGLIVGEMRYNGVHRRMMLNPNYSKIGIGVAKTSHPGFGGAYTAVIHYE